METIKVIIDFDLSFGAVAEYGGVCADSGYKTLAEVKSAFEESFRFHLEGCRTDGDNVVAEGEYELVYELTVMALLNHYKGIISFAALSKITGINERLIGHYATGYRNPRSAQRDKIVNGLHAIGKDLVSVS